jgi:hypothetical protein
MRMQPQQLSAEMVHPGATGTGAVDDDMPTRRIPKVQTPRQQVSGQQIADPMGADSQAVDARKVEGDKGLGEKSDVVQDYRARVEAAQLPDNVREAALSEVGKLERISDASSQSGDIRTWLDTILDLPWSTEAADWIDIQGSREVEAALRMLIEPTVADVELADAAEVESAEVESADVGEVEIAKVESPEVEAAEVESAEVESAVADVGEVEAAEVESAEVEAAVADVGEVEAAEVEVAKVESPEVESAVADVGEVEAAEVESAEVESAVADVGEVEAAEVESAEVGAAVADVGEVEAVEAESGDVESAEVESAAAEVEQVDAADVGPQDDDTVEMAGAAAAFSGDRHVPPQPPEQHVAEPQPVQVPREKRRIRSLTLAATVLALLIGAFFLSANRDGGVRAQSVPSAVPNDGPTTTATVSQPTSVPSDKSTETVGEGETIQIEDFTDSARPFEAVRIQGRYPGGEDTFLQVQRRYEGKWVAFPLPTKTDQSGEFTAFVEPGPPGRYRLRVLDPDSGVTSKTFVVVVKG